MRGAINVVWLEIQLRSSAGLQAEGLVIKEEPYTLRVPRSQRGGEVVEPLVRDQWFVRMKPLAERALAAVADGDVKLVPERFEKTYNHWLENIRVRIGTVLLWSSWMAFCRHNTPLNPSCRSFQTFPSQTLAGATISSTVSSTSYPLHSGIRHESQARHWPHGMKVL